MVEPAAPSHAPAAPANSPPAPTPPPPPPTEAARLALPALLAKAHALRLAEDPHWLRLGHWRRVPEWGFRSEAAESDFFLSARGNVDPSEELDATLKALLGLTPMTPGQLARGLPPAACRFPARTIVLQQRLGFEPALVQQVPCPRLEEYFRKLQPAGVSLIFSSYYLNNPSSAFGHTFLRVRRQGPEQGREQRELLDSAVDYAADVNTSNPIAYALKGLFGLFPGTFKLRPYYYKVREYNDYESRDLWEYELELTDLEVAVFSAHVYELGWAWFPYYYVDENCSYHVLAALEAAAPRLELLRHVGQPVIPIDTVKALYQNKGLVRGFHYRPSAATQFEARVRGLDRARALFIERVAQEPGLPLPAGFTQADEVLSLDAAADLIDVRFPKELTFDPDGPAGQQKRKLLTRRAALGVISEPLVVPQPNLPHQTHDGTRLSPAALWSDRDGASLSLGWRLTLHSLDDPPGGYPDLAQIQFFPAELRVQARTGRVLLEQLDFLDAFSLHGMTLFDQRLSWKIQAGAVRVRDQACPSCLLGRGLIGSGAAFTFGPLVLFATADLTAQAGPDLDGISGNRFRIGAGPAGGLRLRLGDSFTLLAQGSATWYPETNHPWSHGASGSLRWNLSEALGVALEARALPEATEAALRLHWFY